MLGTDQADQTNPFLDSLQNFPHDSAQLKSPSTVFPCDLTAGGDAEVPAPGHEWRDVGIPADVQHLPEETALVGIGQEHPSEF